MTQPQEKQSEYARFGVDYRLIEPFKRTMMDVGRKTILFPNKRDVIVTPKAHGAAFEYRGKHPHMWYSTQEGLGNKSWIAEWMYQNAGTGRTYYEGIGIDAALMAVNDVISEGAMPIMYEDEVAAGDSEWFKDEKRAKALAESFFRVCEDVGMALPAGESPSYRYLMRAESPVRSAPSLSGCATGIIAPKERLVPENLVRVNDRIIGVTSSGLHANGVSLVIGRALALPEAFLTKLPNGRTLGEEALIPTRSYVRLVEGLSEAEVDVHAYVPGTGGGVSKVAFDKRPLTYRIHTWVKVPLIFQYLFELGVSLFDCLTTFNWGIGYYIFVPRGDVERTLKIGKQAGYELEEIGRVEEGKRQVIFAPVGTQPIILPPPGD